MKESTNKNGDRLFEEESKPTSSDVEPGVRGGILLERTSSKASHTEKLKREADEASESARGRKNSSAAPSPRLPPSSLVNTEIASARPDRRRAATSKTSTPVVSTFAEAAAASNGNGATARPPSRPSRQNTLTSTTSSSDTGPPQLNPPLKRSHKKGAGLAAQAAAAAAARAAAEKPRPGEEVEIDEEAGDGEDEENEPLYCYCQQVSYGEMVACDAIDCPKEWFHLECAGLDRAPGRNGKWSIQKLLSRGC